MKEKPVKVADIISKAESRPCKVEACEYVIKNFLITISCSKARVQWPSAATFFTSKDMQASLNTRTMVRTRPEPTLCHFG